MTWQVPSQIESPSVADLPFIRIKYERLPLGQPGETKDDMVMDNDCDFARDNFFNPASVAYEQAVALQMLSDETFALLCQAMKPAYFDNPIRSKDDLSALAAQEFDFFNENEDEDGHATFEQLMSYMLFGARAHSDTRWDRIAELYNGSHESQQRALVYYFDKCENRDLLDMLSTRAPAIDLPAAFDADFHSKSEGGDTYFMDDTTKHWLRDDLFANQFQITLTADSYRTLVASAPTLSIALAKAISHVRDSDDLMISSISIKRLGIDVAEGKIVFTAGQHEFCLDSDPRVNWKPWVSDKATFTKTLYAVEKALGMQWSKVRRLEDELGM